MWPGHDGHGVGLLFATVGFAPGLLTSVELARGTVLVEYGPPFVAFGLFTVLTLGWADYVMYRKARRLRGLQRVQVSYVLVGLLASQAAGAQQHTYSLSGQWLTL